MAAVIELGTADLVMLVIGVALFVYPKEWR